MANKMVAAFAICLVVFAALYASEGEAATADVDPQYSVCYSKCSKECLSTLENKGQYTKCETKCTNDCDDEEAAAKLN
ncbi:hypothetical protein G4B88_017198 [Cannabis sativa]|uniref:Uncharacterized protein n=1 Tax=Cannabis sativa TaxID=3483 RepID=A0A7J6G112_CANSA|nr:hypothetical protein G4B88_017198 [Cannabis sativa]